MCVSNTSHGGDGACVHSLCVSVTPAMEVMVHGLHSPSVSVTPVMEVMVHLLIVSWIAAVKGTITNGTNEMTSVDLCSTVTFICS